jgi:hypothetical protein
VGTLSATAVACGGQFSAADRDNDGGPDKSGAILDAAYGGSPPEGSMNDTGQDAPTVVAVYGAPIPDAGVALDADVHDAAARLDSAVPVDSGVDDGSTVVAAYGGPIFDSGKTERDANFAVPYGIPPIGG